MRSCLLPGIGALILGLMTASEGRAQGPALAAHGTEPARRNLIVDGRLGPAYLMKSRSHALAYLFKPAARLGLRVEWTPRLEVGGAAVGLLEASEHYRVLGALAQVRFALWQRPAFSLGASAGLGLGYDADILHADLEADGKVLPYALAGLDGRWTVARSWLVGVEAGWENLGIVHLGALVGFRFGGSYP